MEVVTLGRADKRGILVTPATVRPEGPSESFTSKSRPLFVLKHCLRWQSAGVGASPPPTGASLSPYPLRSGAAVFPPGFLLCCPRTVSPFKRHSHHFVFKLKTALGSKAAPSLGGQWEAGKPLRPVR